MKKTAAILLIMAILVGCGVGVATDESLISKSYVEGHYIPDVVQQADQRMEEKTQAVYESAAADLDQRHQNYLDGMDGYASGMTDLRLKRGDVVELTEGSGAMPLAGSLSISYVGGGVVDVTEGQPVSAGTALTHRHRYLAAENTTASVAVTSDTAVLAVEGSYTLRLGDGVDYNALADALYEMGLFQGTGIAYGGGYELEAECTRIMGLVMFLRLIGEEQAALSSTADNPFADTAAWCDRYVAYAYERGYTNGVGENAAGQLCFAPDRAISAEEYVTLLLRALGYSDSGEYPEFMWNTAIERAVVWNILRPAEQAMLADRPFLRAQAVYLSCVSLHAQLKDGSGILLDRTAASGGLDREELERMLADVEAARI